MCKISEYIQPEDAKLGSGFRQIIKVKLILEKLDNKDIDFLLPVFDIPHTVISTKIDTTEIEICTAIGVIHVASGVTKVEGAELYNYILERLYEKYQETGWEHMPSIVFVTDSSGKKYEPSYMTRSHDGMGWCDKSVIPKIL